MSKQRTGLLVLVTAVAIVAGGAGGFVASRLFESNANAQGSSTPAMTREIIVPAEGLVFKTSDGKTLATLASLNGAAGHRNTFVMFNETGQRAVELNGSLVGGDVSVYDNRQRSAAVSIFATTSGSGQLSIMGDLKAGLYLTAGKDGGQIIVNEGEGFPAMTLGVKSQRGSIQLMDGAEGKVIWSAPK